MPASSPDPIAASLKRTFQNGSGNVGLIRGGSSSSVASSVSSVRSSFESKIQATARKVVMIGGIQFDNPTRYVGSVMSGDRDTQPKSRFIILNPPKQVTFFAVFRCFSAFSPIFRDFSKITRTGRKKRKGRVIPNRFRNRKPCFANCHPSKSGINVIGWPERGCSTSETPVTSIQRSKRCFTPRPCLIICVKATTLRNATDRRGSTDSYRTAPFAR